MTPEQKEKLKKIYELIKRGSTEGERAAAEKALDKMLAKYNLKGVNLDSLDKEWYTKTKNARRKQLQDIFFSNYAIASNFYEPEELKPLDWDSLSKKEKQDYIKLHKVEGGTYNVQVTNGLLLN